jgi:hypothetical protein
LRSGCLNLVVVLLTASVATTLTVVGLFFLLSFAAMSFESPAGIEAVLKVAAALVAAYFFVRIGKSVWRDLKGQPSVGSENPGSAREGER